MSFKDQAFTNRLTITIVVVILCAAGFAYSQGWFDMARPAAEMESNKVSTSQNLDQVKANEAAAPVTKTASEPAATPAK